MTEVSWLITRVFCAMLQNIPKTKIVEKVIRDRRAGALRAYFLVAEFEGRIFWKLLRCEKIVEIKGGVSERVARCLPSLLSAFKTIPTGHIALPYVPSPYISNVFFVSQMTRAPAL